MELKDVILSTLAEIEELTTSSESLEEGNHLSEDIFSSKETPSTEQSETVHPLREDEMRMLEGIRERLLVLFEGFQSPNNVRIEAKVDLTLNFLEYLLATIDNRLDTIKQS
jgi:hypothetical protein